MYERRHLCGRCGGVHLSVRARLGGQLLPYQSVSACDKKFSLVVRYLGPQDARQRSASKQCFFFLSETRNTDASADAHAQWPNGSSFGALLSHFQIFREHNHFLRIQALVSFNKCLPYWTDFWFQCRQGRLPPEPLSQQRNVHGSRRRFLVPLRRGLEGKNL